jgi:(2R)-ethylmalonyl-CoA mutase
VRHAPKWNPINVCSYHLQEAGATPVQEVAYALATAIGVLDGVRASGKIDEDEFPAVVGRISFFVNAGVRFVEETCKMRAFTACGTASAPSATASTTPSCAASATACRSTRSGLTEQQPENNVPRIVLESLGVTLSKSARARAMQLPAWNEALGLPRPWDQQWSLRIQQILAFESDLLEYGDIFEGSVVIEAKTAELAEAATASWPTSRPWAGPSRPSTSSSPGWCAARPSGCGASRRASRRWSASTASPRRPPRP